MTNLIGKSLGRYHILEQLGEGGMATVYKAYDTRLETDVAVKVIRTERLAPEILSRALKRFEREAKALARLTHPNIIPILDYGEYEGRPYLVMPYLPGGTLKERLKKGGRIPWQEAVKLLLPVAQALNYAHQENILHRDVKPSNILITKSGQPMLTDFGIAKILDVAETRDLTGTGMGVGTPEYMAPEQFQGRADARSDVYALGVVLYEMVTERKPYVADTPAALIIKQATDPLPRPKVFVPELPQAVENVLLKALDRKPENRYGSMGEFAAALEKLASELNKEDLFQHVPEFATGLEGIFKMLVQRGKPSLQKWQTWFLAITLIVLVAYGLVLRTEIKNLGKQSPIFSSILATSTSTLRPTSTTTRRPTATRQPTKTPTLSLLIQPSEFKEETFNVSARLGWQSTDIKIARGNKVEIVVIGGRWTYWKGGAPYNSGQGTEYICAEVMPASQCDEPFPTFPSDGLIGRIGDQIFGIGQETIVVAREDGVLSLRINDADSGLYDNDGILTVRIAIKE